MESIQYFFYLLKPISQPKDGIELNDYLTTLSEDQKQIVGEHFAFVEKLEVENKILFGGPFLDAKGIVLILKALSQNEADQIISQEPTVKGNLFSIVESHPIQIAVQILS